MNIVSMIMQYLGPAIVGRLASSLGINSTVAQKLIAAALPTILAGIVGKATAPGGGKILGDLLGKQDTGILGNLGNLIGGASQSKMAEAGLGTLGSLLGGPAMGALTGALGKFGGVDEAASKGLLGMLGPVALGALGQHQKSAGLDAGGLVNMLMGQKDNIKSAIPGDFAKMLGSSGLLDGIGGIAAAAAPVVTRPAAPVVEMPRPAPGRRMWQWLALAVAALLAGWYFLGGGSGPKRVALPVAPKVMAGNTDIGSAFGATLGGLQAALGGIKDRASAEAALPQLRSAQGEIDRLSGLAGSLSADSKKSLASYIAAALPLLMPVINNLLGNSAIAPVVKPLLEGMVGKLQGLS